MKRHKRSTYNSGTDWILIDMVKEKGKVPGTETYWIHRKKFVCSYSGFRFSVYIECFKINYNINVLFAPI